MGVHELAAEPKARRRRNRQPQAVTKQAATLFRIWHGLRDLMDEAERVGDGELVHLLAVAQTLVEDKTTELAGATAFAEVDASLLN